MNDPVIFLVAFILGVIVGALFGILIAAVAQDRASKEIVAVGFVIFEGVRYRLIEAPLPTMKGWNE